MQPHFVPANCRFETDDLEKEWLWTKPFDFIYGRMLASSLSDPEAFVKNAFKYIPSCSAHPPI